MHCSVCKLTERKKKFDIQNDYTASNLKQLYGNSWHFLMVIYISLALFSAIIHLIKFPTLEVLNCNISAVSSAIKPFLRMQVSEVM